MYSQRSPQVEPYSQVSNKQWSKLARQGDSHLFPYWPTLPSLSPLSYVPFPSPLLTLLQDLSEAMFFLSGSG